MIINILIIIFLIFFYYNKKKVLIEKFNNFNSYNYIVVQPHKKYNIMITPECIDLIPLFKNILKLNVIIKQNSNIILNEINNNEDSFGLIYSHFLSEKFKNIKKISYITYSSHCLIISNEIKNLEDLNNKEICVINNNSDSEILLKYLLNIYKIKVKTFTLPNTNSIISKFNNNSIKILYLNILNPNSIISQLNIKQHYIYNFKLNNDLKKTNIFKEKNTIFLPYNNYKYKNIPSNNIWLVSNNNVNNDFLQFIINKLYSLEQYSLKIIDYSLRLNNINKITIDNSIYHMNNNKINNLFNSYYYNNKIDYHPLVKKKLIQLGFITEKSNIYCSLYVGKSKCK